MTDLINRATLVDFMERVLRHMEADPLAADSGAYIRGYRAALVEVQKAPAIKSEVPA